MERYNEYKESGVQWLGEIPSYWELRKMKYTFCERSQKGFPNEPLLAATQNHGVIKKSDYENRTVEATKNLDTLKLVEKGDFVISLRSFQGGIEYSYCRGIISPAYTVLKAHHLTEPYFKHLAKSPSFIDLLKSSVTGIREGQNIDYNKLKVEFMPIPAIEEQQAIATYLDTVTSKIDEAIAQQQKMIDLLNERKQIIINNAVTKGLNPDAPMKDSGVEWIGEIPEHWEIKKLKHVCQAFGRIGFRGYSTTDLVDEGEGCITLSPSNMRDGKMQYGRCTYLSWEKYEESPEIKVFNGDILFVKTGSTYGKSSIVEDLPLEATINPQLLVFKNFTCNNMFLANVLQSTAIKTQVEISVIGGTIPTISQQKILNYVFPFPTEDEQYAIVEYVESKSAPINSAIKAAEKQISLLQERKQIIINDVVTGKVKVS